MSTPEQQAAKPDPADAPETEHLDRKTLRSRAIAWAWWDWGSAAFNAVVTTFVFSTYIASSLFVDPAIVAEADGVVSASPLREALASNATIVTNALAISGLLVALLAPVMGQRSDGSGRRKFWMAVNTFLVVACMASMFFVIPVPEYIWLGAGLLAAGNLFFEFASVNYNAMLNQVSTPENRGRTSGFGWGMGYVGGIVLLALLLVLFIQQFGDGHGILGMPFGLEGQALDVRVAVLFSAVWFLLFSLPVLFKVPEKPAAKHRPRVGFFASYVVLWHTIVRIGKQSPRTLLFLASSAVFRDGMASIFTFGAIIAANVFGLSTTEVMLFAIAANVAAGIGTFVGGWADDRFGPKPVIFVSLVALIVSGGAILFVDGKNMFWIFGLGLTLFVGPVQSASRSFMARLSPAGREGEMFGLYATTGRAVSFFGPLLIGVFISLTSDTRFGIIGILIMLGLGLLLLLPVRQPVEISDADD